MIELTLNDIAEQPQITITDTLLDGGDALGPFYSTHLEIQMGADEVGIRILGSDKRLILNDSRRQDERRTDLAKTQSLAINPLLEMRGQLKDASEAMESTAASDVMLGAADSISRLIDNITIESANL